MKLSFTIWLGLISLVAVPVWAQEDKPATPAPAMSSHLLAAAVNPDESDAMLVPPPVSGQSYPVAPTSEERSNYLRGGVTFNSAYSDNVLAATNGTPLSDVSYSVWPTIALDETTTRLHTVLTYAPGFTFYQRDTSRNEADENLAFDLRYRLSPHVTMSLHDGLQKSSDVFNQPGDGLAAGVSGSAPGFNDSIIAPLADRLSNNGNAGISYQFSRHAMIGGSGTFSNLHYANPSQVPGLYDAATRAGSAFYSYRVGARHYLGATYQYQDLLSYPTGGTSQTQTDGISAFYTFYASPAFSFSLFGGPQYYNSGPQFVSASLPPVAATQSWTPAAGGSVGWQALHSSVAASYSHSVSGSSGLIGAVKLDSANLSLRQQITRNFSAGLAGAYANNGVIAVASLGGHSVSATAALQQLVGTHLNLQAGYTRLHQDYSFFAANPDTNREWVAVTYQFARALGR
jgi:hypothetical protein